MLSANSRRIVASSVLLLAAALAPAHAEPANAPGITSVQADEILAELRAIHQLLEKSAPTTAPVAAPADEKVSMTIGDSPALGSADAPLTLVEFTDYQCPFCRSFHTTVFEQIKKNFVDTGKLRFISRDLPLSMHEHATQAAAAARCAGEENKFWTMRQVLIVNARRLQHADLLAYARSLHLDMAAFTRCLDQDKYAAAVQRDAADAAQLGITGTPSFVLGPTVTNGPFVGTMIVGAQPYAVFEEKIRALSDRH